MRRGRGSWWWAQIGRALVFLALGFVSMGISVLVSSHFDPIWRPLIMILTWALGVALVDIRVQSELVEEERS